MILNLRKERSICLIQISLKIPNDIYKSVTFWIKKKIYREFDIKKTVYKPLVLLIKAINLLYFSINENSKTPL